MDLIPHKLEKPTDGEPKWDFMITIQITRDFCVKKFKVGKGFLKRMLKKINIEL